MATGKITGGFGMAIGGPNKLDQVVNVVCFAMGVSSDDGVSVPMPRLLTLRGSPPQGGSLRRGRSPAMNFLNLNQNLRVREVSYKHGHARTSAFLRPSERRFPACGCRTVAGWMVPVAMVTKTRCVFFSGGRSLPARRFPQPSARARGEQLQATPRALVSARGLGKGWAGGIFSL